jgi:Brp/Blh family beta-carotene 15,15'-monooxygenase
MSTTSRTADGVPATVMLITGSFVLLGAGAGWLLALCEPFLVLGMMIVLGLPHGATDHGLFQALKMKGGRLKFLFLYGMVIGLYGLLWYTLPMLAFGIFMLLSIYHFGQSNWAGIRHETKGWARLHYLLWGSGILLTPILLHAGEASLIVAAMTGISLPASANMLPVIGSLAVLNVVVMLVLSWRGVLSRKRLVWEVVGYGLLMALFFTNSLLLGFTVYFVCWHSLSSARDQLRFFSRRLSPDLRRQLSWEIGGTIVGALAFCLFIWLGPGPEAALQPGIISGVFIFISLLTLPHMLLIEQLYANWSPAGTPSIKNLNQSTVKNASTVATSHTLNHV